MNLHAVRAIYKFEMARTFRTLLQSLVAPVVSTSLYFVVFGTAIGSRIETVEGVDYGAFIVPGLIMLTVLMQSISNASFGIYFPKFIGTIYEVLSAPVSFLEIVAGYVGAAATKSFIIGIIIYATANLFVSLPVAHPLAMLAFLSNISLSGAIHSVVIAHVVMCAPFAMAITRLRLSQMDQSLEAAAWNLGASEWMAMRHVIVPFCKPAIFASLMITMAVSFDEFAVSWFVSGLNETLPVKVLGFLQGQVSPRINVIGTFVFLTSITLVILAQILIMKRSSAPSTATSGASST